MAAFIEQLHACDHGLEVVRLKVGDFFQRRLCLVQLTFVQVQACELALGLGAVGLGLERSLIFVNHVLQRAEVQPLFIG